MTRADVVADAHAWYLAPTPFVHQQRVRGVGSDCIGIVGGIARDRGHPRGIAWEHDPTVHAYGKTPDARLVVSVERFLERIKVPDVQPGDVVLMRVEEDPQHFAIVVETEPVSYLIHASNMTGRVVKTRLDDRWRSRVLRAYRYPGIE